MRAMLVYSSNKPLKPVSRCFGLLPERWLAAGCSAGDTIRILIVDDSKAWRSVVAAILKRSANWQVVDEASNGLEAVHKSQDLQPDVVLLSIALPQIHGLEAAQQISKVAPLSKIVFLAGFASVEALTVAMMMGAYGYILKSDAATELLPALEAASRGKIL